MALAIDATSPARVSGAAGSGVATTATFDPPASLLVACVGGDGSGDLQVTMSNNGAALTWTPIVTRNGADSGGNSGLAQAHYTALNASRTGMTVTATLSITQEVTLKLYVVTGANAAPIGGSTEGSTASQSITTSAFTTTGAASLGFVVVTDYNNTGAATSSDTTADGYSMAVGGISGLSGYKVLGAAASSATFAFTTGGASPLVNWVSFEVLVAAGGDISERFAPDAILAQTGLTGAVTAIQDDPDSPDGNWLVG